jgi:HK97 family phage portal protein
MNSIPDTHPLLLSNLITARGGDGFGAVGKTAYSADDYLGASVRMIGGYGSNGAKPRPFNQYAAIRNFASWVYKATMLNANAVARIPLREYVKRVRGAMFSDHMTRSARDVLSQKQWKGNPISGATYYAGEIDDRAQKSFAEAQRDGKACLWKTRAVGRAKKMFFDGRDGTAGRVGFTGSHPSKTVSLKVAEWDGEFEEVTEPTPELKLLSTVNPWMNGFGLTQLRLIYLLICGNSYTFKVTDPVMKVPCELWPMPSQYVSIKPSKTDFIDGYVYGMGRENEKTFAPDEIIHNKLPNPGDLHYGLGKVQVAWTALGLHSSKRVMDQAKFDNMNRPDWAIIFKAGVKQEGLTRFEEGINAKFQGPQKSGKFMALGADASLQQLNQAMEEIGDADRVVEEIAAAFDTPVSMLKANDPNRSSAQTADTAWLRDSVRPLAIADEEDLNSQYLPAFDGGGDSFLAYDPVSFEDETTIVRNASAKLSGGLTCVDEAREEIGYEPLGGAEGAMRFFPSGATGSSASLLGNMAPGQMAERTNENGVTPGQTLPDGSTAEGDVPLDANGSPATPSRDGPQKNSEGTLGLNGAQITAAVDVFNKLRSGTLWKEAAIESLVAVGISRSNVNSAINAMPVDDPQAKKSEKDQEFLRQVWLAFLNDGTINDVLANMTALTKLRDGVGVPGDPTYKDPYLPVQDAQGRAVTGELIKDADKDIIGAAVQEPATAVSNGPDLAQD